MEFFFLGGGFSKERIVRGNGSSRGTVENFTRGRRFPSMI